MWTISSSMRFAVAVLVPDLQDPNGLGWSYWSIAFAFSLQWLLAGLAGPVMGWLGDRHGVRLTLILGTLLFVAGMLLTGTMTQIWQFYLYFGLLLGTAMAVFQVPLVSGVTVWFRKRLGLAMGTMQAVHGLGTAAFIPLMAILFTNLGLRWTFWVPGIIGGTLLFILLWYFRDDPAKMGLRPVGAPEDEPIKLIQRDAVYQAKTTAFLRQAQRKGTFWNLIGIHFWGCMGHNIFIIFLVAMAVDGGLQRDTAVGAYLLLMVVSMITRFVVPILADRTGTKIVLLVCFSLQVLPPLLLLVTLDPWAFYVFAIVFGIGLGGEVPAFPIINRQYFGTAPIGAVYGWQMLGNGVGMALGPLAGGFLWDLTGDFVASIWLSIALSFIGLVSVALLPTTSKELTPDWENNLPNTATT